MLLHSSDLECILPSGKIDREVTVSDHKSLAVEFHKCAPQPSFEESVNICRAWPRADPRVCFSSVTTNLDVRGEIWVSG